jgi:hypothetical protein
MYKRIAVAVGDYLEIDTAVASALALAAHTDAELLRRRVRTAPLTFGAPDMVTCSHLALDNIIRASLLAQACPWPPRGDSMKLRPCWRILTLALSLLVVPCGPEAQQPRKLVGLLSTANLASEAQWHPSPFRHKLEELGWHEGDNIVFARCAAEGETERLPDLAAALVRLRPDVIVIGATPGVRAV